MAYFDLDVAPILDRCSQRGDVRHVRHRIRCGASPTDAMRQCAPALPLLRPLLLRCRCAAALVLHVWLQRLLLCVPLPGRLQGL